MSFLEVALRLVIRLAQHPTTQTVIKYALRQATAEVVRQVQHRTRASTSGTMHIH